MLRFCENTNDTNTIYDDMKTKSRAKMTNFWILLSKSKAAEKPLIEINERDELK